MRISGAPSYVANIRDVLPTPDGLDLLQFDVDYALATDLVYAHMICATVAGTLGCNVQLDDRLSMAQRGDKVSSVDTNLISSMYANISGEMNRRLDAIHGDTTRWPQTLRVLYGRATFTPPAEPWGMKMTPEGKIKARLNKALKSLNQVWKYMPVPSGYGMQTVDYLLCVAGHFVAIETKAPGKQPTPRQEATLAAIKEAGGLVFVVDSDESMDACIGALVLLHRAGI